MKNKTILVLEDQEEMQNLYMFYLEDYNMYVFHNPNEVLRDIPKLKPDLMIVDLNLPGMNGMDFIKTVRTKYHSEVPIIIISGAVDFNSCSQAFDFSVNQVVQKPFEKEELLAAVERYLGPSKAA